MVSKAIDFRQSYVDNIFIAKIFDNDFIVKENAIDKQAIACAARVGYAQNAYRTDLAPVDCRELTQDSLLQNLA